MAETGAASRADLAFCAAFSTLACVLASASARRARGCVFPVALPPRRGEGGVRVAHHSGLRHGFFAGRVAFLFGLRQSGLEFRDSRGLLTGRIAQGVYLFAAFVVAFIDGCFFYCCRDRQRRKWQGSGGQRYGRGFRDGLGGGIGFRVARCGGFLIIGFSAVRARSGQTRAV